MVHKRLEELDSLRGMAAITVLLNHYFNVIPAFSAEESNGLVSLLKYTPLHFIWSGHEAVIMFFILSGFVLSLPFLRNTTVNYPRFFFKRVCRIYLPYVVAVLVAILLFSTFSRNGISDLSEWFNIAWTDPFSWQSVINYLIMLGDFKNFQYNPVIWSLIHEMRISLIFPFIMYVVLRLKWRKSAVLSLLLAFCSYVGLKLSEIYLGYVNYGSSIFDSFYYTTMFVIGVLLAQHLQKIIAFFKTYQKWNPLLLATALMCYTYPWWFFPHIKLLHIRLINEWFTVIGVVIIIVLALSSSNLSKFLKLPICTFFGKISYSLYLWHAVILLTCVNMWYGTMPLGFILVIASLLSILISTLSYYLIEEPSIKLGKMAFRAKN
ncbi:acyltransferase [Bacillus timonensis]|nr:acyltransferase [Bacillus timonensis]